MKTLRDTLIKAYLSYWNDYITVEKFARDNNIDDDMAAQIIKIGKALYNERDSND